MARGDDIAAGMDAALTSCEPGRGSDELPATLRQNALRAALAFTGHARHAPLMKMFYRMTEGMRITVQPHYAADHSDPAEPRHVFVYHIRIENVSEQTAQLLWRHWDIHDAALPEDMVVEGEGVVGEQPVLGPGDVHEYESFCVLRGTSGWMEGWYEFLRPDGAKFRADVPRFELNAGAAGGSRPHPMA